MMPTASPRRIFMVAPFRIAFFPNALDTPCSSMSTSPSVAGGPAPLPLRDSSLLPSVAALAASGAEVGSGGVASDALCRHGEDSGSVIAVLQAHATWSILRGCSHVQP